MRVLILTPINPVLAGAVYRDLAALAEEKEKKMNFLCFPFFAEIECVKNNKPYLPTFFSMLEASFYKDVQRKLYNKKNVVVIGNTYKRQKFDVVVACDLLKEDVFDRYLDELAKNEDLKEFVEKIDIDSLYKLEDATVTLPTTQHAFLFLEGVYDEKNKAQ